MINGHHTNTDKIPQKIEVVIGWSSYNWLACMPVVTLSVKNGKKKVYVTKKGAKLSGIAQLVSIDRAAAASSISLPAGGKVNQILFLIAIKS